MTEIFNYIYKKVNIINDDLILTLFNQITNKNKFFILNLLIIKNNFLTEDYKNKFMIELCKIQRVYHIFTTFARIYKYKKA